MTLFQKIDLLLLSTLGKKYNHIRLSECPKCKSFKIWGHGYTERYFDGFIFALFLKRWICADCGCVICIRPEEYFARHHTPITEIYNNIKHRIESGTWIRGPDLISYRQKKGHWLRSLKKNIISFLGFEQIKKLLDGFQQLIIADRCPIIRST